MSKKRETAVKHTLSATQEVLYANEFKKADRAGGYEGRGKKQR